MYRDGEIESQVNEDGDTIITLDIDSNVLPGLTVDTYQTFNGDSWLEYELEYRREECGETGDWSDYDITYNHSKILEDLAQAAIDSLMHHYYGEIIESVELLSTYSPSYYNFETDSFKGRYTINLTKLDAWITEQELDVEDYGLEKFQSYDGFRSYVPSYLEDPETRDGTLTWLKIVAYMEREIDHEAVFMGTAEAEYECYSNNVEITYTKTTEDAEVPA